MAWFNMELMAKFIAPELDMPPTSAVPDLSREFEAAEAWMQQYFLSSVFQGEYTGEAKVYAESIIARIQMTFAGYQAGRAATLTYCENWQSGNPGIGRYLAALREWESVFLNMQVIHDLLGKFMGATYSTGGREDRSRIIANRIKHVSEDIAAGKMTGPGTHHADRASPERGALVL